MKGPGYTVYDLAYWTGLIAGTSCTYLVLTSLPAYFQVMDDLGILGWARIVALVTAVIVGATLGFAAERTVRSHDAKKRHGAPPDEDPRP